MLGNSIVCVCGLVYSYFIVLHATCCCFARLGSLVQPFPCLPTQKLKELHPLELRLVLLARLLLGHLQPHTHNLLYIHTYIASFFCLAVLGFSLQILFPSFFFFLSAPTFEQVSFVLSLFFLLFFFFFVLWPRHADATHTKASEPEEGRSCRQEKAKAKLVTAAIAAVLSSSSTTEIST